MDDSFLFVITVVPVMLETPFGFQLVGTEYFDEDNSKQTSDKLDDKKGQQDNSILQR